MKPIKYEIRMSNDVRIAVLETTILNINSTLLDLRQEMRHGFEKIDQRFEKFDEKFDEKFERMDHKIDQKTDSLRNLIWSNFFWLTGMMIGLAGLIAHTQHWI